MTAMRKTIILCRYGLNQLIHKATRVTNTTSTTIDLIFVTDKELYRETGIFRTSISDHYLVYTRYFSAKFRGKKQHVLSSAHSRISMKTNF